MVSPLLLLRRSISIQGGKVSDQRTMRGFRWWLVLLVSLAALFMAFGSPPGHAQDAIDRKVKTRITHIYPDLARKMGLAGSVKLEVVVSPNGTVKETKVIGGHPILVSAAVDAVKKWKFETASGESTGTVEFRFDPGN